MTTAGRWAVSATVAVLVAASSLLAARLVPAPHPTATPSATFALSPSFAAGPSLSLSAGPGPSLSPTPEASARPSPSFRPIRIAATAAGNELFGVSPISCPTCVSGSRVQYVGQGHGIVVHLANIAVAGPRTLIIFYESDGARPLEVVVADHPAVTLMLPGKGSWITPAQARLTVDLPAGDSAIRLFHATGRPPTWTRSSSADLRNT